ncbi:hypothetical protein F0562_001234 [Nyssa sinensis]|uniref:PB1 domain-containing protein n=1 Tax=Nyssa sinensis TaxID=561372 RepID=A0A5J5C387_9ASTE|nr:hypothetical protein F0562_001234 [Nyssa sinensis]
MGLGSAMTDETIANGVASEAVDRTVAEITGKEDFDVGTEHDLRGDWRCNQRRNSVSIVRLREKSKEKSAVGLGMTLAITRLCQFPDSESINEDDPLVLFTSDDTVQCMINKYEKLES